MRALHGKVARQRHDFYHKLTAELVTRFAFLGTEALAMNNMSCAPKAKPDRDQPGAFLAQWAEIKIETFPFTRYGTIPAEVSFISSDAVNE